MNPTESVEVIPLSVGEEDYQHGDFDPPGLPDSGQSLDGRTITSAVATVMADSTDAVEVTEAAAVIPAGPGVTVNGRLIAPGTGVRYKLKANALMPNDAIARVKIAATLSDGSIKNLVHRFKVNP